MYKSGLGVNFCLVRDGKVLLQQRDEYCPHHPLEWCFPGGAVDDSEVDPSTDDNEVDLKDTAIREIFEEYHLVIREEDCEKLVKRPENNPGFAYVCHVPKEQEPVLKEGKSMKWASIDDLPNVKLGFNHNEFITPALLKWHEDN